MTRVGHGGPGDAGQGAPDFAGRESFEGGREAFRQRDGGETSGRREGRAGLLGGRLAGGDGSPFASADRSAAFERSVEAAAGDRVQTAAVEDAPERDRVLALVEWAAPPSPFIPEPVVPPLAPLAPNIEARVTDVVSRVEQAIRAELFQDAGRPVSIRIELPENGDGVQSITIAMSATTLDVRLQRGDGRVTDDLLAAAQALAERLQARFSRRVVRVLDAGEGAAARGNGAGGNPKVDLGGDGFSALARMMGAARS